MKGVAIPLISVLILVACANEKKEESKNVMEEKPTEETAHDHSSDELKLNEGAKWKVDDSMMVYLRNMESTITNFLPKDKNSYQNLSDTLKSNIDLLTSNCTMKGAAHDELHKWLIPYIDKVNDLAESENQDETVLLYQDLKNSFSTFNQFFE